MYSITFETEKKFSNKVSDLWKPTVVLNHKKEAA